MAPVTTFAVDTLVEALVEARAEPDAVLATREVLARTVADPAAIGDVLQPARAASWRCTTPTS